MFGQAMVRCLLDSDLNYLASSTEIKILPWGFLAFGRSLINLYLPDKERCVHIICAILLY